MEKASGREKKKAQKPREEIPKHELPKANGIIEIFLSDRPDMAKQFHIDRTINEAAFVLERIDRRWPAEGVRDR